MSSRDEVTLEVAPSAPVCVAPNVNSRRVCGVPRARCFGSFGFAYQDRLLFCFTASGVTPSRRCRGAVATLLRRRRGAIVRVNEPC
jgi:hypothetical protein